MLNESVDGTMLLYRGYNGKHADDANSVGGTDGNLWTTDEPGYAKVYAIASDDTQSIVEYSVDEGKMHVAGIFDLDRIFGRAVELYELIDGFDDRDTEKILANGFNCVFFDWDGHGIYLLLKKDMITSKRILSKKEIETIEISN